MRLGSLLTLSITMLTIAVPGALSAQQGPPLAVQGQQDLSFGELLGGLATRVSPNDAGRNAQLRIRGARDQTIEISFDLPAEMSRPEGGSIPLLFGAADAQFSASGGTGDRIPFDPNTPWTITLTQQGWSWIFLGGTVQPPPQAPLGTYSATITLTLSDLGS